MDVQFMPNVDIRKAFNSEVMLINDEADAENGLCLVKAGADGPPIHKHPLQVEHFKVVSGYLEVYKKDKWVKLSPGQTLKIPKDTAHTFRSRDSKDCIFEYRVSPKGTFSEMLQTFASLMRQNKITSTKDIKSLIYLSMTFKKYKKDIVSVEPPQVIIEAMAGIGKLLGFRF